MQKQVTSFLLFLFISFLTMPASAQFAPMSARAAKNLANLDRMVANATKQAHPSVRIVNVPAGIIKGNRVALSRPVFQSNVVERGPVIASLRSVEPNIPKGSYGNVVKFFEYPQAWLNVGGKAVYTDQTELAQDVDHFYQVYEENSSRFVAPGFRLTKLYMLPVDGILYKQTGYATPVVLKADEYFIIYDTETRTGKIAEHTPEVYAFFKSQEQYVQEQLDLANQAFAKRQPHGLSHIYQSEKEMNAQDRENDQWRELWNMIELPWVFTHVNELGKALHTFHSRMGARVKANGITYYVYELPVKGLVYEPDEHSVMLDGNKEVVLYSVQGSRIVSREQLETSPEFIFVK